MNKQKIFTMYKNQDSSKGLSLIEVAIVLIVLGLLVAWGTGMFGTLVKRSRLDTSRDLVKASKQALIGFAMKNHRLPCPDTDGDGVENCPYSPSSPYKNTKLPYATIGMKGNDAYLQQLYYDVNESLTTPSNSNDLCIAGKNILTEDSWPDPPRISQDEGVNWSAVAALVFSTSENMTLDISINSNTAQRSYESKRVTADFDDIVEWIDVGNLLTENKCQDCTSYTVYNWNYTGGNSNFDIWVHGGPYTSCTKIAKGDAFNVRLGDLVVAYCDSGCTTYCYTKARAMVTYWRAQSLDSGEPADGSWGTVPNDCIVNAKPQIT